MKKNWEYNKLGEVASFINGYAFKPEQWKDFGVPIIRIQNLNNPDAPYNYYDGEVPDKVKVTKGDLLISWSASLGVYIWDGCDAYLNQHIFKVKFDKIDIEKLYLKYAVASKLDSMAAMVHGATMKHIVKSDFDNTIIPVPPISTQQSIVEELDNINNLINIKTAQLQDLDALAQSIFYEMFGDPVVNEKGWELKKFGNFAFFKNGLNYHPSENGFRIKCIGVGDFKQNSELKDFDSINDFCVNDSVDDSYFLQDGDIIIVRSNGSKELVGRNMIVYPRDIKITYSGFCIRCRTDSTKIIPIFLNRILSCRSTKNILRQEGRGCNISNINQKILSNLPIPLPPLSLQQKFAEKIEAIEKQKQIVTVTKRDLETLLASRMQYWFE